jgi:hypothetical protein
MRKGEWSAEETLLGAIFDVKNPMKVAPLLPRSS